MSDMPGGPTPPPPPPPPGTPPGAGGLRPRTLGEILSAAFEIYKANASKLLVIVAIVVVPLSLIGALIGEAIEGETTTDEFGNVQLESQDWFAFFLGLAVVALVYVIISAILQAAMMRAAALATIGDPVDVERSYRWGLGRFGPVILVAFLVGLAIFVGIFLILIGAIVFATFLAVSIPALVIENRRGTDALKRSWNLVSGSFWHVLGVIIVSALITGVVSGLIGGIGGDNWFVAWIFTAIAQIVTAPYAALVSVLLYLDLRARKEALTADSLRGELASNA